MLCFAKREITLGLLDYVASQEAHAIDRAADPAMAREEDEQKRAEQRAELKRLADEDRMKVSKLTQAGTLMKPVTTSADGKNPTPTCGKCGSTAPLTRIPGGRRCPNCGEQFQDNGVGVLPLMPSRGELLK
jgi:rubrerythrin